MNTPAPPKTQTLHWLLLSVASAILLIGAIAAQLASSRDVAPLTLTEGESVTITIFRVLPDTLQASLRFDKTQGSRRPELGEFTARSGANHIEFDSPGEPVVVQIQGRDSTVIYEALPAGVHGSTYTERRLVIRDADGNPNRFVWPPDQASKPKLPIGRSEVTIKVLNVGAALSGERIQMVVEAPLSFKTSMPGYGFLWWFFFWPVWAVVLLAYAGFLVWRRRRAQ